MEEKTIEKQQEHQVIEKKVYASPTLMVYGKLSDLTAGGSKASGESTTPPTDNDYKNRSRP
jgi:hypothetical protein